jgi:hypothetical protein
MIIFSKLRFALFGKLIAVSRVLLPYLNAEILMVSPICWPNKFAVKQISRRLNKHFFIVDFVLLVIADFKKNTKLIKRLKS